MKRFLPFFILVCLSKLEAADISFSRDVRPILAENCFHCHGFDAKSRKANLRFDTPEGAFAKREGMPTLTPQQPEKSNLYLRIISEERDEVMPPPHTKKKLTPAQIQIIREWITQGAKYEGHWAFEKPTLPEVPTLKDQKKVQPIDAFIRAKLETAGIEPSPRADKSTLIRRVTLDLTGLLPTPQEVEDFLKDNAPDAYEKVVDRLLASPHYGERQARYWLDLARYADSNGYTIDGPRSIWPWRDWVIKSFNADTPFDQFTIEQMAGDLLPKATKEQQIATGFHRNTSFNEEGGTDPEQFRVERTIDRTNTTATVWLGLTFGCAQCHDHKYDPISQKDYYQLYAFFNSCDEPTLVVGGKPELEAKVNELTTQANELKKNGKPDEAAKIEKEIKKLQGDIPSTLVLRERKTPRETYIQIRGDFLRKGETVSPNFPTVLNSGKAPHSTRLDLARWLISPENPLTARVQVNRVWQQFFGRGLVETENDFGTQGAFPTHPQLLDWLAVTFRTQGWSQKKLIRQIVLSETYQQSSQQRKDLIEKDPNNYLLAKQNRLRLEAEIIRDVSLCASGLLSPKIGGAGIYPPQPPELFKFTQNGRNWPESKGEDRYRRGMYIFIWRQAQHPLLTTFDGADAQTACTKRNRSNTPLQALHLANDPVFIELAAGLGKRLSRIEGTNSQRIEQAFLICFSRQPEPAEKDRLEKYLDAQKGTDPEKWTRLARVLMNLDEFITRE
jgi:hypothetical protein